MSHRFSRFVTATILVISAASAPLAAQASSCAADDPMPKTTADGWDFAVHGYGVGLGSSTPLRGLRLGMYDTGAQSVDGASISILARSGCDAGRIRGLTLGIAGPYPDEIQGIAVGGIVRSRRATTGITAGLSTDTDGWQRGITASALLAHAREGMLGLNVAGIATVSDGSLSGVSFAPIVVMAGQANGMTAAGGLVTTEGSLSGITVGGLAVQPDSDARWITLAGLGTAIGGSATGVSLGGLWLSSGAAMTGVNVSGLVVRSGGSAKWLTLTPGILSASGAVEGIGVGGLHLGAGSSRGLIISATNSVSARQSGIAIGLINDAADLHGIQIGLLNRVRNRHGLTRMLPLLQVGR